MSLIAKTLDSTPIADSTTDPGGVRQRKINDLGAASFPSSLEKAVDDLDRKEYSNIKRNRDAATSGKDAPASLTQAENPGSPETSGDNVAVAPDKASMEDPDNETVTADVTTSDFGNILNSAADVMEPSALVDAQSTPVENSDVFDSADHNDRDSPSDEMQLPNSYRLDASALAGRESFTANHSMVNPASGDSARSRFDGRQTSRSGSLQVAVAELPQTQKKPLEPVVMLQSNLHRDVLTEAVSGTNEDVVSGTGLDASADTGVGTDRQQTNQNMSGQLSPDQSTTAKNSSDQLRQNFTILQPAGSQAWREHFGDRIVFLVKNGVPEAGLALNPPHLGPLEVKISLVNDQVNITFSANSHVTREILEQALPRLKELLSDAGIGMGEVDISGHSDQSGNHQRSLAKRFGDNNTNIDGKRNAESSGHIESIEGSIENASPGLLNIYV